MGKKHKHSQDKLYKTVSELKSHHVDASKEFELSVLHRRLKFDSCCLSLDAVTKKPMGLCDDTGFCYVFECDNIVKFLEKYKVHPITGEQVSAKQLIELRLHKNDDGLYHCPVIYKLLNQYSKIVVNKKTGHVYSYEAYQQLNLKPSNFKDLLTDEPFEKDDIAIIQDPEIVDEKWNVSNFHHVKNKLKLEDDTDTGRIRSIDNSSSVLKSSLEEYKRQADAIAETHAKIVGQDSHASTADVDNDLDKVNSASYSDGRLAGSVTSTVAPVASVQRAAALSHEQVLYPRIKKKGYVQLMTNYGPINLELFCDRAPKTCHNFLLLASRGYYDNSCFHRLIKNFILQGGDPTGTGSGGQSAWGEPFKDECFGDLKHVGRGVLAMANLGPGTNKSQFYITLRGSWDNLDGKHTIFGRVVGGDDTLESIESVQTDKKDRPKSEIKILRINKYADPFEEAEAAIEAERRAEREAAVAARKRALTGGGGGKAAQSSRSQSNDFHNLKRFRSGIGAYVDVDAVQAAAKLATKLAAVADDIVDAQQQQEEEDADKSSSLSFKLAGLSGKKRTSKSFGNFANW